MTRQPTGQAKKFSNTLNAYWAQLQKKKVENEETRKVIVVWGNLFFDFLCHVPYN